MIIQPNSKIKVIALWIAFIVLTLQQDQVYNYERTFSTNLRLTQAIAISPYQNRFAVGAENGQIKIYNYDDSSNGPFYLVGHLSRIVQIVWGQSKHGIVSVSSQNTSSLAIQYNTTLSQSYIWDFQDLPTYGASLTQNSYQGYIAFNHRSIVNSYSLRTKQITNSVTSGDTEGITDAKYTNGYRYLYVTQGPRVFTFTCGSANSFFNQYSNTFNQISPDFSNQDGNNIILKQTSGNFSVFSRQNGMIVNTIPILNIVQFKYCEADYIIGLSTTKKLYLADKLTFDIKQIIEFNKTTNVNVVSFICDKKIILVGYSNGEVDLYKLAEFNTLKLIIILFACFIFLIIIVVVVWRIVVSKKGNSQNQQPQPEQPLVKQKYSSPPPVEPSWRRKKQKQETTITKPSAFDASNWQKKQDRYKPSRSSAYDNSSWGKRQEGYKPSSRDNDFWRKQQGYKPTTFDAGSWSKKKYYNDDQDQEDYDYNSRWK